MTSFANAFAPAENTASPQFSNVDLDQQTTTTPTTGPDNSSDQQQEQEHSSYVSLTDAATFHTEPVARVSPTSLQEFPSTTPIDRRISIPDMTKISASSAAAVAAVAPTIDKFKQWSRSAYKCTKQTIFEKLGKTTRTVDVELENQIEQLRETKRRYETLLALARSYANHFANLLQTQRALSDTFLELKHKSFHLCDEYGYNAETQTLLVRHGETLMQALNFFISTLNTLCHKTIEDTINTIRLYEISRLEYDACRTEMEMLPIGSQLTEKQREFEKCKEKYEKLKCDVGIKMQFLDENQTKVMKKQLLLFHNAIAAYFSGNHDALAATMKQFNLKVMSNGDHSPDKAAAHPSQQHQQQSFLEQPFH